MIITNAKLNGMLKNIEISDGKIVAISTSDGVGDFDAKGMRVIPGLIDVHTHGYHGIDCDEDMDALSRAYADVGTTSFLACGSTCPIERLRKINDCKKDVSGANILGVHFEGPYINLKKQGGMDARYVRLPDADEFEQFDQVKLVSVAPELAGAMEFIRRVSAKGVVVALGHTTADFETAMEAFQNGASCLTHMFNAMDGLHHRKPGPIGAALMSGSYVQLICDGFHIHHAVIRAAFKLFGERVVMISDSVNYAGMPDGTYPTEEGRPIVVHNKTIVTEDGTISGSYMCLLDGIKVCVDAGVPFDTAVDAASRIPAEMLGVKKGRVAAGFDADLLIVDDDINLKNVILRGEIYK